MATDPPLESGERDRTLDIHLKAARIFHEKGFDATSMDDLARALQITKAGLYYYIKSKEGLLFAILDHAMDWLEREVIRPARTVADPEQRLCLIIRRHGRELLEGERAVALLSDEVAALSPGHRRRIRERKHAYLDLVRDTLVQLRVEGKLREVDPTAAAFSLFGILLWLPRWFLPQGRLASDQVLDSITTIVLGGFLKGGA